MVDGGSWMVVGGATGWRYTHQVALAMVGCQVQLTTDSP